MNKMVMTGGYTSQTRAVKRGHQVVSGRRVWAFEDPTTQQRGGRRYSEK